MADSPRAAVVAAALAAGFVAAAVATGAAAGQPRPIASYCSETGDLCFGVVVRDGAVSFEIQTVARYFDRYFVCVDPPRGGTTCRSFAIRASGGSYASKVRWHRNFPPRGPGSYAVTWRLRAHALGPPLRFRLPLR